MQALNVREALVPYNCWGKDAGNFQSCCFDFN